MRQEVYDHTIVNPNLYFFFATKIGNDYQDWLKRYVGAWVSGLHPPSYYLPDKLPCPEEASPFKTGYKRKRGEQYMDSSESVPGLEHQRPKIHEVQYYEAPTNSNSGKSPKAMSDHKQLVDVRGSKFGGVGNPPLPGLNTLTQVTANTLPMMEPTMEAFVVSDRPSRSYTPSGISVPSVSSKMSTKWKLEGLEFNCIPTFMWNYTPTYGDSTPEAVRSLMLILDKATHGDGCIPQSLKETINTTSRIHFETIPDSWFEKPSPERPSTPSPEDLGLWDLVQDIVRHTTQLEMEKAEESEYYSLIQKILAGSDTRANRNILQVKQVTTWRFDPKFLPQDQTQAGDVSPTKRARKPSNSMSPVIDIKVDVALVHKMPSRADDTYANLPLSLVAALKGVYGSMWTFGPFASLSLVTCVAEVKTSAYASRLDAAFQAALGGSAMIQARMDLVEKIVANPHVILEDSHDMELLQCSFPVVTLVILGDSWYYQILFLQDRTSCFVIQPRLVGSTTTHGGAFRVLQFVEILRAWCADVYATQVIDLLKIIGKGVGWIDGHQ